MPQIIVAINATGAIVLSLAAIVVAVLVIVQGVGSLAALIRGKTSARNIQIPGRGRR
ncbi:MAG: hypothetical protein RLZZ298_2980 [Pseudomonadota bacterium]|jgi:hypothetical protein